MGEKKQGIAESEYIDATLVKKLPKEKCYFLNNISQELKKLF